MLGAITGIWASRNNELSEFFTSVLYPYAYREDIGLGLVQSLSGTLWQYELEAASIALPSLQSGTLIETIVFKTYNDWPTEDTSIGMPVLQAGTLIETIVFKTYNDWPTEDASIGMPVLQSGTLVTTINYINYNDWPTEDASIGLPTLLSGTLT